MEKNVYRAVLIAFYLVCSFPVANGAQFEVLTSPETKCANCQHNVAAVVENCEWLNLFNGEDLGGWHMYNSNSAVNWVVEDGVLFTEGGNGDIVTDEEFENFVLEVEWKIEKGGNSGIFYYVIEDEKYKRIWETGPEFQIIDENNYPVELLEKQKTGACSDVIAPSELTSNPPGEWNITRIISKDGNVEHWLNGNLVLSFSMDSEEWKNAFQESKFAEFDYAKIRKGKIGLQDHGNPVFYRKIRICNL